MYQWLWNHLPGPVPVRLLLAMMLFAVTVVVLFLWVFPWLETRLPFTEVTVEEGSGAAALRTLVP